MILLDTNVVSELMRLAPAEKVEIWARSQAAGNICLSAITEAEILYGLALLPVGRRRDEFRAGWERLEVKFADRVLPFDRIAANHYARIRSDRRKRGRQISEFDAQIASIARSRGATLATRNTDDFEDCGVSLANPWRGT